MPKLKDEIVALINANSAPYVKNFHYSGRFITDDDIERIAATISASKENEGKQAGVSDAVEFAEWINDNNYLCTSIPSQKEKYWQFSDYNTKLDEFQEGEEIPTQQLYNLFREQTGQPK